jgi:hypothetical protein
MDFNGLEILRTKMGKNDPEADTIGEYLIELSSAVWSVGECFSGKRPFGNSGWYHEIYQALCEAYPKETKVKWYIDEDDPDYKEIDSFDEKVCNKMIDSAYESLYDYVRTK